MSQVLIVDGYNVLNAWPELNFLRESNLEHARAKFLDALHNYSALYEEQVIVVFDAHQVKGAARREEQVGNVTVIFSREGETADSVIERLVVTMPRSGHRLLVATSDWAEQRIALGHGALRISARELYTKVEEARREVNSYSQNKFQSQPLDAQLSEGIRQALEKLRNS